MKTATEDVWELWRQDDNGNRFLIGRYPSAAAARDKLQQLTRSLHKQTYWINAPRCRARGC